MSERLRYSIDVPATWSGPEERELPMHLEELYRGDAPAEGLLAQFIDGVDPEADLAGWAEAPLRMTGSPAVVLALVGPTETLAWGAMDATGVAERLAVDEVRVFAGWTSEAAIHTLLARRGTLAWHLGLSLAGPDADARAAAAFGTLALG